MSEATARAPASISNLGPGFDALGAAICGWEDEVHVQLHEDSEWRIGYHPDTVWYGPTHVDGNTASVAAKAVAAQLGYAHGATLTIKKGIRAGSGLGSSAASAVAAAVAMQAALGMDLDKTILLSSCLEGESVVSGARHGDNVIPSLMGGVIMTSALQPDEFISLPFDNTLHLSVVFPEIEILTQVAREMLPDDVPLAMAATWAARLGRLVDAFHQRDARMIGEAIMTDTIIEPLRASLIAPYSDIKSASILKGAFGCALSGSGPSMFALCPDEYTAQDVANAMLTACKHHGLQAEAKATTIHSGGAYLI